MNKVDLEKLIDREFSRGISHWCGDCHSSQKVVYASLSHQYIFVHYDCTHVRTYELKREKKDE